MDKQYENGTIRLTAEKDLTKDDIAQISSAQGYYSLKACDELMNEENAP